MAQNTIPVVGQEDVHRVTVELAKAAGISEEQARSVLKVFNISKLVENVNTARQILADPTNVSVLGYSQKEAEKTSKDFLATKFTLENLRLSTRKMTPLPTICV